MFYNARWYEPALGRFAQADTIIPVQTQGTQAWDRYAYTNNNPVRYTDPSGHRMDDGCRGDGGCSGGGGGGGIPNPVDMYMGGWNTFGAAWSNTWNPNASLGSKFIGNMYMSYWLGAHILLGVGTGLLVYGAYVAITTATTVGAAANTAAILNDLKGKSELIGKASNIYRAPGGLNNAQNVFHSLSGSVRSIASGGGEVLLKTLDTGGNVTFRAWSSARNGLPSTPVLQFQNIPGFETLLKFHFP